MAWAHIDALQDRAILFSFCNYHFVLEPATKVEVLNIENSLAHRQNSSAGNFLDVWWCIRLYLALTRVQMLLRGPDAMFFMVHVRRTHIVRDALTSVMHRGAQFRFTAAQISHARLTDPRTLRKPLRIEFDGEDVRRACACWAPRLTVTQGVDAGGVRKEFFQLVVKGLFDPDYGAQRHRSLAST